MIPAAQIVNALLEDDLEPASTASPENPDTPQELLHHHVDNVLADKASGVVNQHTVLDAYTFWHRTATYSDGVSPIQCRKNGAVKTWKRQPGKFRVPVKYGMYDYFYIDNDNAHEWSTVPPPKKEKPKKVRTATPS